MTWYVETDGKHLLLTLTEDDTIGRGIQLTSVSECPNRSSAIAIAYDVGRRMRAEGYRAVRKMALGPTPQIHFSYPAWMPFETLLRRHGVGSGNNSSYDRPYLSIHAPRCKPVDHYFGMVFHALDWSSTGVVVECSLPKEWHDDDPDAQELWDLKGLENICRLVPNDETAARPIRRDKDAVAALDFLAKNRARFSPEVLTLATEIGAFPTTLDFTSGQAWNLI